MSAIIDVARGQLGTSVTSNQQQVQTYIQVSGGTPDQPGARSWCGDFAFWVLAEAKVSPLPDKWHPAPLPLGSNAIPRFFQRFPATRFPLPGDMYYRPLLPVNGTIKDVEHVGFVIDPDVKDGFVHTINGNAGGPNADWNLGLGGGCVSESTETPLTGPTRVQKFLQVATDAEAGGRWAVQIGVWAWHYIFKEGGEALCTDIRDTLKVRFVGAWAGEGDGLRVTWQKTGSVEQWGGPLVRAGQHGVSHNHGYSVVATKLETKAKVMKTTFRFDLD